MTFWCLQNLLTRIQRYISYFITEGTFPTLSLCVCVCVCVCERAQCVCVCVCVCVWELNRVRLFATPWTRAHQAPLFIWFSKQEYRSGLTFPVPRDLPNPGIEPESLACSAFTDGFFNTMPGKPCFITTADNLWNIAFLPLTRSP